MLPKSQRNRMDRFQGAGAPTTWPTLAEECITPDELEAFRKRVKAIQLYYEGSALRDIAFATGVSPSSLYHAVSRCVKPAPDGQIWGYRALLPQTRVMPYQRQAPVFPKLPEVKAGQAGALRQLFDRFPDIEQDLINFIRKESRRKQLYPFALRAKDVHRRFIELVKKNGVAETEWPFTARYLGARSISIFHKDVLDAQFSTRVRVDGDNIARAHANVGTGKISLLQYREPYAAVELDGHLLHTHLTVDYEAPDGSVVHVPVSRLWLIALIERESLAVLSYTVVRGEITADDVRYVIAEAINKAWQPKLLTIPHLAYRSGAGMPSHSIPELKGALWGTLMVDGALAHLADQIRERVRQRLGFSMNWGPVAHFERRQSVERLFRQICQEVIARLPSTTGSNPARGRARAGDTAAAKHGINIRDIEQILDVFLANHNAEPNEGLFFLSPLDFLQQRLAQGNFIPRHLPRVFGEDAPAFPLRKRVTVRGTETRRPYVQIDRVHYTNEVLANARQLKGEKLIVEIDEDDMRQIKAFLSDGSCLGYLTAETRWNRTKHDRKTRRAINSLLTEKLLYGAHATDLVEAYLNYLSQGRKPHPTQNIAVPTSRAATEAARVATDAGVPLTLSSATPSGPVNLPDSQQADSRRLIRSQSTLDLDETLNRRGR